MDNPELIEAEQPNEPTEPARISVAFTAADWQHVQVLMAKGAQKAMDEIAVKHNSLIEQIDTALQPPTRSSPSCDGN